MNDERPGLSGALHALADRDGAAPAPVEDILRRGRAVRRKRAATLSGAALGVVAVTGAVAAFAAGAPGAPGAPGPAVTSRTGTPVAAPGVRLAAAVQRTAGVSFHFTSYADYESRDRSSGGPCTGGWDPKRHTGFTRTPAGETRIIGGDIYDRAAPHSADPHGWRKVKLPFAQALSCTGTTVMPSGVLRDMRKEGPVRFAGRRTHAGVAYDVYTVTSRKPELADGSYDTTQAWVGATSGYVERLLSYEAPKGATAAPSAIIYDHIGAPVRVARP